MTPQQRRAMRREQVERCLSTTMTIRDWCALNGVPKSTMYEWMSRFRKEEPEIFGKPNASQWIELSRDAIAAQTALVTTPAPRSEPAAPPACRAVEAGIPPAPIIVRVNRAEVAIPAGSLDAHIVSVLRAVASL